MKKRTVIVSRHVEWLDDMTSDDIVSRIQRTRQHNRSRFSGEDARRAREALPGLVQLGCTPEGVSNLESHFFSWGFDPEESAAVFATLEATFPGSIWIELALGTSLFWQGEWSEALEVLASALQPGRDADLEDRIQQFQSRMERAERGGIVSREPEPLSRSEQVLLSNALAAAVQGAIVLERRGEALEYARRADALVELKDRKRWR